MAQTGNKKQGRHREALPKDDSLEDSANLEDPDVIAAEIVEDLARHLRSSS